MITRCDASCDVGFYGVGCTSKCKCENNGICNYHNGTCACESGYHGEYCQTPGEYAMFGLEHFCIQMTLNIQLIKPCGV